MPFDGVRFCLCYCHARLEARRTGGPGRTGTERRFGRVVVALRFAFQCTDGRIMSTAGAAQFMPAHVCADAAEMSGRNGRTRCENTLTYTSLIDFHVERCLFSARAVDMLPADITIPLMGEPHARHLSPAEWR